MSFFKEEKSKIFLSSFLIDNRHLLKEIRRKNSTENTTPNTDKAMPTFETPQARQDLAAVVHEV